MAYFSEVSHAAYFICNLPACPFSCWWLKFHENAFYQDFEFSMYSPNMSLTSQRVPCNSNLCELQRECSGAANLCPYKVAYVSADTSSSGTLVEDVLYLMTEDARSEVVEAKIIFGYALLV